MKIRASGIAAGIVERGPVAVQSRWTAGPVARGSGPGSYPPNAAAPLVLEGPNLYARY